MKRLAVPAVLVVLGVALSYAHDGDAAHNRKDDVIAKLTEALQDEPDSPKILKERAYLFLQQNEYEAALADFEHLVRVQPKYEAGRVGRAWARFKTAQFKLALADLDPLCSATTTISGAWFLRGEVRHSLGDDAGAKLDLDHALGLAPSQYPHGRVVRANVLAALGDAKGAREDLTRVIEGNPRDKEALVARSLLLVESDWDQAKRDLDDLLSTPFSGDDPAVRAAEARIQVKRNGMVTENYKKALVLYDKDVKGSRSLNRRAALMLEAAQLRIDMGDLWPALKQIQEAIELAPERVDAHRLFVKHLEKADGVLPETLARARARLGEVESANGIAPATSTSR